MDDSLPGHRAAWALAAVAAVGAFVAVILGVVAEEVGEPRALETFGFSSMQSFKAWTATGLLAFVMIQLLTAVWIYAWLPGLGRAPSWVNLVHRSSGVLAVLGSLPVAYYCIYAFGFDTTTDRTFLHSIAGCAFYGTFVAKMLTLRLPAAHPALLPVLGGVTFTAFLTAWWTAAWWWFELVGWIR